MNESVANDALVIPSRTLSLPSREKVNPSLAAFPSSVLTVTPGHSIAQNPIKLFVRPPTTSHKKQPPKVLVISACSFFFQQGTTKTWRSFVIGLVRRRPTRIHGILATVVFRSPNVTFALVTPKSLGISKHGSIVPPKHNTMTHGLVEDPLSPATDRVI